MFFNVLEKNEFGIKNNTCFDWAQRKLNITELVIDMQNNEYKLVKKTNAKNETFFPLFPINTHRI